MHFEELWEKCENFHQEDGENNIQSILDNLEMKIKFYRMVDNNPHMMTELKKLNENDDKTKAKSRLLGEILLTLTNLSLKDNINVFDALAGSYKEHTINYYVRKYPSTQ
jgi:hypothetical protein